MVAVSAARVKVVAIERFARHWRSTLTRFAATAGRRQSGNGGRVVGVAKGSLRAPALRPGGPGFARPARWAGLRPSGPVGRASPVRAWCPGPPAVAGRIPARPPGLIGQRVAIQWPVGDEGPDQAGRMAERVPPGFRSDSAPPSPMILPLSPPSTAEGGAGGKIIGDEPVLDAAVTTTGLVSDSGAASVWGAHRGRPLPPHMGAPGAPSPLPEAPGGR
ncbi:hypothetical protein GCM10028793_25140 [Nocardiopsis oceani]